MPFRLHRARRGRGSAVSLLLLLAAAAFLAPIFAATGAFAQDGAAVPPAEAARADELAGLAPIADVPVEVYRLRLKPLTAEELETAADEVQGQLQAVVARISDNRVAALEATGEEKAALDTAFTALTQLRGRVAQRMEIALESIAGKGGDPATRRRYLDAVSGIEIQADDAAAWITFARDWATSPEGGIALAVNVGLFVLTLIVAWIAAGVLASVVRRALGRMKKTSNLLQHFLVGLARKTVLLVGFVVALANLGLDIGPLVAAIGAAGLVIGFALQGTLSNFASGILILLYRPFDVGDVIDAGGTTGKVEAMSLVSTTMITPDNQQMVVPNNAIWNGVITNITGRDTRRVDLVFGIGYGDDMAVAQRIMEDLLANDARVLKDPAPTVRVSELADSSVNFICRPWVKTSDYWDVYWDLTRKVKERFDAEGVSIPFPQRDVHIHQASA